MKLKLQHPLVNTADWGSWTAVVATEKPSYWERAKVKGGMQLQNMTVAIMDTVLNNNMIKMKNKRQMKGLEENITEGKGNCLADKVNIRTELYIYNNNNWIIYLHAKQQHTRKPIHYWMF